MSEDLVLYETDEKVGIITINRPEKLNAVSPELRGKLCDAFAQADADETTSVVILRANGRSFCVGYDINTGDPEKEKNRHDAMKWHDSLTDDMAFEFAPWDMCKPVIASVQGHALGGGCELTMFCDITIAADNALFGEPEIRFSNVGPAIIMPWIIGFKKARELLYFGDMIDAETAERLGMVNHVVPDDKLEAGTRWMARRIARNSEYALRVSKMSINQAADIMGQTAAVRASGNVWVMSIGETEAARGDVNDRVDWSKSSNERFDDQEERPW